MALSRLSGPEQLPLSATALYTAPSAGALLTSVIVSNTRTDSQSAWWSLWLVPSGQGANVTTNLLVNQRYLVSGDPPDVISLVMPLTVGDAIHFRSSLTGLTGILIGQVNQ